MELRIRSTVLNVEPSDTSGFLVTLEVADAEELRAQLLRGPDDGADDWPLAKRYGEICDRSRELAADLARATAERDGIQQSYRAHLKAQKAADPVRAAAPAMLEALEYADETFKDVINAHRGGDWIDLETYVAAAQGKIRIAIAQARGEEVSA